MSNAVPKTTAQILTHGTVGRNNVAGPGKTEADDDGRRDHEKAYRDHRRKAAGADRRDPQDFSRRVVRAMRPEGANGHSRRCITHHPSKPAHNLSTDRGGTTPLC